MLKRKALEKLRQWRQSEYRKTLIISGARQVGKTYIVREFGKEYTSFIELNFLEEPGLKQIFQENLDVNTIIMGIRLSRPECQFVEGNTLLFLDEIQECPNAITALKFLNASQSFDTVASGSALGMIYNRVTSYPVGNVEYLDMYSLDFEEFMWALGIEEDLIEVARKHFEEKTKVENVLHQKLMFTLKQYLAIGGMPEVVSTFVKDLDYIAADQVQRRIYRDYLLDIARYAEATVKLKAEKCYQSIPLQLSKLNHKFQFSVVEKKGNARKFESSLDWLESAHMIIPVKNVSYVEYPLQAHEQGDNVRIYPSDLGLLVCTYDYAMKQAILRDGTEGVDTGIVLKTAKGGLYEALIADILTKAGHKDLHFYRNEAGTAELEFFIEGADGVIPVEVKAGKNRAKTLDNILKKEDIVYGYKLADQNVGVDGKRITLPLYMAIWL